MGRHKDKKSLELIDQILRLGNEFGFISEDEYNVQGLYDIDVVWKLSEDDSPYVTFEIESRSPSNLFKNILKIFITPSDVFEKPRKHFVIIMRGNLSKGDRLSLFSIEKTHNMVIIEDYLNLEKNREKFHEQIHRIAKSIRGPINKIKKDEKYIEKFTQYLDQYFEIGEKSYRELIDEGYYIKPYVEIIVPMIEKNEIKLVGKLYALYYDKLINDKNYRYSDFFVNNEFINLLKKAYEIRPIILNEILNNFGYKFMDYWINSDARNANELSHLVLRLCVEFINKNMNIIKNAYIILDNISSDFFMPSLMAKQIMLISLIEEKINDDELVKDYTNDVSINDEYAWDAMYYSYLRDSIYQAEKEQHIYKIDISNIKYKYLNEYLESHMEELLESFISFLGESDYDNIDYEIEYFDNIVSSYEFLNKEIISDIKNRVYKTNNTDKTHMFEQIFTNSKIVKIIKNGEARFTIPYLVELLRDSNNLKFNDIGLSLFGVTYFTFYSGISEKKMNDVKQLLSKYNLVEDELDSEHGLSVELDQLWFQDKSKYELNLSNFLTELHQICRIKEFNSLVTFKFRDQGN